MNYELFLFDLDDTLLDFKASEELSFTLALQTLGLKTQTTEIFKDYQAINTELWKQFEHNQVTKDFLKVERFRKTFELHGINIKPEEASQCYLDKLPETVVLIEGAVELCRHLSSMGEIGIITNGIQYVQKKRIDNSGLAPYLSFISVSDECGFAKPDVRFFEYSVKKARTFDKKKTIIIGDRLDADIQGAHNFGIDSCWFNPHKTQNTSKVSPTFELANLVNLMTTISKKNTEN